MVWRLRRPLYGLKQAPRQWQLKLKTVLADLGLKPSSSDPSLFVGQLQGTWLLVYVDDLLLVSDNEETLSTLKESLKAAFPMKDLGPIREYLGMEVHRDWEAKEIRLSQKRYIQDMLRRFDVNPSQRAATPLPQNHGLSLPQDDETCVPEQERYPELVGSLMYAMVCTRPDTAHALSVLSICCSRQAWLSSLVTCTTCFDLPTEHH